jgi:hypothetical protein
MKHLQKLQLPPTLVSKGDAQAAVPFYDVSSILQYFQRLQAHRAMHKKQKKLESYLVVYLHFQVTNPYLLRLL